MISDAWGKSPHPWRLDSELSYGTNTLRISKNKIFQK